MKSKKLLIAGFSSLIAFGCAQLKDTPKPQSQNEDTVQGTIVIIGNEPFTKLTLQTENTGIYEIKSDSLLHRQLWEMQNKNIILTGSVQQTPFGKQITVRSFQK